MNTSILANINSPEDLKKLNHEQLIQLAYELRKFIIEVVSDTKGHLGAGLGVVELTIALHYVYQTPYDKIIWDVGHQCYPHKIITGRKATFRTLRQKNGISGFPKRSESEYDVFGTGHSSTSISALLGMAIAAQLQDQNRKHIAVIGDASIASGMAFEALNHAGVSDVDMLLILNDNEMGIDPQVGALKNYLTQIKQNQHVTDKNIFQSLNLHYTGPIDGHNLPLLIHTLQELNHIKGVKMLHIITTKGKGLESAEKDQVTYHAPGKFDKNTGKLITENQDNLPPKYQDVFGLTLVELATTNPKIIGITAAMPTGTSLKYMLEMFPKRTFDVGIAEQHAVTLAAGFASEGFKPYVAIYSTFLQRGYDQVIHDVALQKLPVVFCIDRAGIVGEDGATHHGVYDMAYLNAIPNFIIAAPSNEIQLRNLLYTAQYVTQPFAIRYPRQRGIFIDWRKPFQKMEIGSMLRVQSGGRGAIVSVGHFTPVLKEILTQHPDLDLALYDAIFIKPLDEIALHYLCTHFDKIITFEDGVLLGGYGQRVSAFIHQHQYKTQIKSIGIPDEFIEHATTQEIFNDLGWSPLQVTETLREYF